MLIAYYTADNACRALGLTGLVEPEWRNRDVPSLRLLFTPTGSGELCVTITSIGDQYKISLVATSEPIYEILAAPSMPCAKEEIWTPRAPVPDVPSCVRSLIEQRQERRSRVIADGMLVSLGVCSISDERTLAFAASEHPSTDGFLATLLADIWEQAKNPTVRNALRSCAAFVDVELPVQTVLQGMLVLGPAEDSARLLDALVKIQKKSESDD